MSKVLFLIVATFGLPVSAISQAAQSICTPPGFSGNQLTAIQRVGVGEYTLTATIQADMVTRDGKKSNGGVTTSFQARDGQGRTRVDMPMNCVVDKSGQSHWEGSVTITDPVANTHTSWQVWFFLPRKSAVVTKAPSLNRPIPDSLPVEDEIKLKLEASRYSAQDPEPEKHIQTKAEDLGNRMIVGLESRGMRITTTYPVGLIGNAQPIIEVEDRWVSEQYRIILLDTVNSSIFDKSSYEVTRFTLGEPDPSLFQPPPDYRAEVQ